MGVQRYADTLMILADLLEDDSDNFVIFCIMYYCIFMLKNYLSTQELWKNSLPSKTSAIDEEILVAKGS